MNVLGRVLSHPFFLLPLALTVVSSFQQYMEALAFLSRIVTQWNDITGWFWERFALVVDWPFRMSITYFQAELNILVFAVLTNLVSVAQYKSRRSLFDAFDAAYPLKLALLAMLSVLCFLIFMPAVAASISVVDLWQRSIEDPPTFIILAVATAVVSAVIIAINNYRFDDPSNRLGARISLALLPLLVMWSSWEKYREELASIEGWSGEISPQFWESGSAAEQALVRAHSEHVLAAENGLESVIIFFALFLTFLLPPRTLRTYIQVILLAASIVVVSYGVDLAYGLLGLE